ncbi:MAG: hypothetical protein OHK0057_27550 [Thermoflexibacter sp.]
MIETVSTNVQTLEYTNPFLGLRPFRPEESHLYFGRSGEVSEVLKKLIKFRFVALLGTEGVGKTSFLNCGLVSALQSGVETPFSKEWKPIIVRLGHSSPLEYLSKNLAKATNGENIPLRDWIEAIKNGKQLSEIIPQEAYLQNILLIIDQFEEVFYFSKHNQDASQDVKIFVSLIINAVKDKDSPIYVALGLRSGYLGECAQFPELTKKINDSEFLLPQMHPEQLREAISAPVEVMNAKMTEKLIEEILNDMKNCPEQLPLMQHALMRTWEFWKKTSSSHEMIDVHHYHAIGGMKRSLSLHADEIYSELSDNQKIICEKIFKSITRKSEDGKGINQPTKLSELADIVAVSIEDVSKIVEAFRKQGRSILLPSFYEPLQNNSLIELSNPDITTLWSRLDQWALEETESVKDYVRLAESAVRHQQGKGDRLKNPELQLALNWYKKEKPTLAWGVRHHPSYELAIQYLEFSDKEDKNEIIRKRKVQKRNMLITRIIAVVFILLGIGGGLLGAYAWIQKKHADKEAIKANEESEKAKQSAIAAEQEKIKANKARDEALIAKVEADSARKNAEQQKILADAAKNDAILAKTAADQAMVKAIEEKKKADIATQQALMSQEETQRIRNLSMASAMAVKAPKITDPKIMAKVARQAYIIHRNYKGDDFSADQYSGLYHAIKSFEDEEFNVLKGHRDVIRDFVFISGENSIKLYTASSDRQSLSTYIPPKGKELSSTHTSDYIFRCMSMHPNGKGLMAGTHEGLVLFYQSPTSAETNEASPLPGEIVEIEPFDNQRFITIQAGIENPMLLWNSQKVELNIKPFKRGKMHDFAISNKNKWIGCATDGGDVFYLDSKKQWEKVKIDSMSNKFWTTTFSPDEKFLLAGDSEGNMYYWNIENPSKPIRVEMPKQHTARITEMKFSPNGKWFASASLDGTVRLWNWTNLKNSPIVLDDYGYWVTALGFTHDNQWLITGCSNGIVKWFPTDINYLFNRLNEKISDIMTLEEWQSQVSENVPYDKTFKELQKGK